MLLLVVVVIVSNLIVVELAQNSGEDDGGFVRFTSSSRDQVCLVYIYLGKDIQTLQHQHLTWPRESGVGHVIFCCSLTKFEGSCTFITLQCVPLCNEERKNPGGLACSLSLPPYYHITVNNISRPLPK